MNEKNHDEQHQDVKENDVVIPIVHEEVRADTTPVVTGGVRVTKHVQAHDEAVQQEIQKSRVVVKRVKTNRAVDGPQPVRREGGTLIVPVVSQVLRIEKQWVVTEEIHITELQETETVQNKITLNREEPEIERIDKQGNVAPILAQPENSTETAAPSGILQRKEAGQADSGRKGLSRPRSIIKNRRST